MFVDLLTLSIKSLKPSRNMDNHKCGGYIFNSNFDSGNLAKIELVKLHPDILPPSENIANVEFNTWTNPDCGGTEFENLNRSWFLFSIHGGDPFKVCKINVVNLNKQAKLFSQGMHPVIRIGETGKWERIKDSPTYFSNSEHFTMSFLHKPLDNVNVKHYYAFTFPFTYTECQEQLERFDKLYSKKQIEINYIIKRLMLPTELEIITSEEKEAQIENTVRSHQCFSDFTKIPSVRTAVKRQTKTELESEIYYHRELLMRSIEGRNIDLLTITSFNGIQLDREERIHNLFPDTKTVRCNTFKNKKIIFISSRVHPGETPASFVLNGFLKLIFDQRSVVAAALRKMYVFKIVPFLNPDGVYNGCYRSDTLGHNLNRMYLSPKIDTQPSIFAVRKLIRYYHYDKDVHETTDTVRPTDKIMDINNIENTDDNDYTIVTVNDFLDNQVNNNTPGGVLQQYFKENVQQMQNSTESSRSPSSESEVIDSCETKSSSSQDGPDDDIITIKAPQPSVQSIVQQSQPQQHRVPENRNIGKVFHEKLMTEIKPIVTNGPSAVYTKKSFNKKATELKLSAHSARLSDVPTESIKTKKDSLKTSKALSMPRKELYCRTSRLPTQTSGAQYRITKRRNTCQPSATNLNISSDFTMQHQQQQHIHDEQQQQQQTAADKSNMFLYIDLHGHASKKGIFMYGNHLPNTAEAVECMLLPRLMSMNCHHFHFDSCVFSERNMYHTSKRDGLSKEGSGRVAVYKTIGLIKSYTLESNYNTGKYVNVLPARGKEGVCRKINLAAPKYTPIIFEDVGRALGPSILDLTNSNPLSRIPNSEFKTLQGLRNSLRVEIDKSFSRSVLSTKALTTKAKRLKNSTPCCGASILAPEISSKENKGKNALNKQITTTYGKKEGPSGRKKGKILCDVLSSSTSVVSKFQQEQQAAVVVPPTKRPKVTKKIIIPLADGSDPDSRPSTSKHSQEMLQVEISTEIQIGDSSSTSIDSTAIYFSGNDSSPLEIIDSKPSKMYDAERPCCSHSIRGGQITAPTGITSTTSLNTYPLKTKKQSTFPATQSLNVNQTSGASTSATSLLSSLHGKKQSTTVLKIRSKYGAAAGSSAMQSGLLKPLKRSNSSKDSLRLKKKKILKTDSNLKRKKSRVF